MVSIVNPQVSWKGIGVAPVGMVLCAPHSWLALSCDFGQSLFVSQQVNFISDMKQSIFIKNAVVEADIAEVD